MRDALPQLTKAGVAVVGISPDKVPQQKKFDDKNGLGFPLLSDTDHRIADAYGYGGKRKCTARPLWGLCDRRF